MLAGCAGEPSLRLVGVGHDESDLGKDVFVHPDEETALFSEIVNEGDGTAWRPRLSFSELACMTLSQGFDDEVGATMAPGTSVGFPLTLKASSMCKVQTIVDWFIDADEDSARGTFNVILQEP